MYDVWRVDPHGQTFIRMHRWRWQARLHAWDLTHRMPGRYEVRDSAAGVRSGRRRPS